MKTPQNGNSAVHHTPQNGDSAVYHTPLKDDSGVSHTAEVTATFFCSIEFFLNNFYNFSKFGKLIFLATLGCKIGTQWNGDSAVNLTLRST